jgi:hypothetical protein
MNRQFTRHQGHNGKQDGCVPIFRGQLSGQAERGMGCGTMLCGACGFGGTGPGKEHQPALSGSRGMLPEGNESTQNPEG